MEKPKGFADRVESWMARIPGVRTYREREHRRETDKKLREHLASRLQEVRSQLKKVVLDLSTKGQMESLGKLDRLSSHLQQMADTIRYASYGYSGIFDVEKIREDELNRLYTFDLLLVDDLERIQKSVEEIGPASSPAAREKKVEETETFLDSLETKFNQRKEFMSRPAENKNPE
jgi:hypothetical protein